MHRSDFPVSPRMAKDEKWSAFAHFSGRKILGHGGGKIVDRPAYSDEIPEEARLSLQVSQRQQRSSV